MDFDLNSFAAKLGARESDNNYENKKNPIAYGRYQFTVDRLNDLKNKFTLPEWYGRDYFDSHHSLQDLYFSYHIQDILNYIQENSLNDFIGLDIISHSNNLGKINIYGLVAGAHLGGNYGLKRYLAEDHHDANDGRYYISDYVVDFSNEFQTEPVPDGSKTFAGLSYLLFGGLIITGIILYNETK